MDALNVMTVGEWTRPEFRGTLDWLVEHTHVIPLPHLPAALSWFQTQAQQDSPSPVDLLVLAQAWPGQFADADLERLWQLAPLVRTVLLAGGWCEGEGRSGHIPPSVFRWPAHLGRVRLATAWQAAQETGTAFWNGPLTAGHDDCELFGTAHPTTAAGELVVIGSRDLASSSWLPRACESFGWTCIQLEPQSPFTVRGAAVAIWDALAGVDLEQQALGQFVQAVAPAPVLVLANYPRARDRAAAQAFGLRHVLAKPCGLAELEFQLRELAGKKELLQPV